MNFIKNIFLFFKRILKKEQGIKMLEAPAEKTNFVDSLKINEVKEKKKVETLICVGDGLGIQTKISY